MSTSQALSAPIRLPGALAALGRLLRGVRSRRRGCTVFVVVTCLLSSSLAVSLADSRRLAAAGLPPDTPLSDRLALAFLAGAAVAVSMTWRRRWPLWVTMGAAAAALLFPLDVLGLLIGLTHVVARLRGRAVWAGGLAAGLGTTASVWRDAHGHAPGTSFWGDVFVGSSASGATSTALSWWAQGLIVVVLVALSVGAGLFLRTRRDLQATRAEQRTDRDAVGRLSEEMGRQAERERIAREVHDVLGHRLSLLSLHAGALEVAAGEDPRVRHSASLVREGAQQSMDDLRSLLSVLRDPSQSESVHPTPSLAELPRVIEESMSGGMQVQSTVYLDGAARASHQLARAVYRIVQEMLTNARKHAPGAPVRLRVEGDDRHGIRIEAANYLVAQSGSVRPGQERHGTDAPPHGRGAGLAGIAERAAQLDGESRHGVDALGVFRVEVWLPWTGGVQSLGEDKEVTRAG
ncbi:sensor histidine kinase [Segeticoccus rhizosphaerae]|jgi:signal transduction histidine kinase|uniref:sensor histidine kinase n=1 Tax=Segeticoccus rhizosphaerae TaxID=1104777 RepID=UPI0010C0D827|nr:MULTISPECIES: histidine kinase [Intrasporangiaceae]